ncbi:MAG: CHAD domain-containing protein [Candidatus Eremiobacteraeota bacterium]|nr:CHAD domain-containing protein [Candidatus Eremiobacteraeota bacterium]MBV8434591.1 CHAD domain-containing protein [Candidatus Eremiobacteraeota bacterium]MBV8723270.1 CHAD domain-containing protein [Candidatus Eremiobacteraeota bacterium]
MKWLARTIDAERRRLERARRRFLKNPEEECLHDVRTTGRRLRSFLEDVRDLAGQKKLLRQVKRAAAFTDAARDAAVLLALLERTLDESEHVEARALLDQLRERKQRATTTACKRLRRTKFS